jgi:hypothetical protein
VKLDEANFYTKIIELGEVYHFVVENIFIQEHLGAQIFYNFVRIFLKDDFRE